jgi:release factor glutamine methyltransferase
VIESGVHDSSVHLLDTPFVVGGLVDSIAVRFSEAGIPDAAAEARDVVAVVLGENRFWPRLHSSALVSHADVNRAMTVAARRTAGMPFAYAVGQAAFRHLTLLVNDRVLIPRQETEVLVDLVLDRRRTGACADVGTGSGAIALALATEGNFDRIVATDIDADAITVARQNADRLREQLRADVEFRCGDLLAPLANERCDVLVSNPPYIAHEEATELPEAVRNWEPCHALFSGAYGLDATRRIIDDASGILSMGGLLALEVDSRRANQVAALASSSGHFGQIEVCQDLVGRDRFVLATRMA